MIHHIRSAVIRGVTLWPLWGAGAAFTIGAAIFRLVCASDGGPGAAAWLVLALVFVSLGVVDTFQKRRD